MLLLYILFSAYILALVSSRIIKGEFKTRMAGRMGLSAVLLVTGIGHFIYPDMAMMIPDFIPYRLELVFITGIVEIAAAIGFIIPKFQKMTAWLLIIFLILILPCNIYAAMNHINFKTGALDGDGPNYLWFRIPLQIFLIGWTYYFGIYVDSKKPDVEMKTP